MSTELQNATVQSLMDVEIGGWDYDILNDICNDGDRELIKYVPLSIRRRNNSWFWFLDDKGRFTVRSVNRFLQGNYNMEYSSCWKKLWSLKIPGKVSNFL